ncbi:metal ABC transporter permease [Patescibacteria group bacterium]|nr:metal ABC transporter permease [Patescibacteria group bacterium]
MLDILTQTFMQHALLGGLLISVAAGIIGSLVVIQRRVFIAGGIAHSAYGGVGLAYYLGFPPLIGALIVSVISGVLMGYLERHSKERSDTVIGVVWALGMAIGVIFVDLTKGYAIDLMSFLFGSIIAVSRMDLWLMAGVAVLVLLTVLLLFKNLLAYSFDPEFSVLMDKRNKWLLYLTLILVSLTVVVMIRMVGLILVIALLTIPASIAEKFTKKLSTMMGLAILLSAVFITSGLIASYFLNLTAGAMIVLIAGLTYFVIIGTRRLSNN